MARKTKKAGTGPETDAKPDLPDTTVEDAVVVSDETTAPDMAQEPTSDGATRDVDADVDTLEATDVNSDDPDVLLGDDPAKPVDEPEFSQDGAESETKANEADLSDPKNPPEVEGEPETEATDADLAAGTDAEMDADVPKADDASDTETVIDDQPAAPDAPPPIPPQTAEQRGPGFVPLVLGGLIAGAIGYAIPTFFMSDTAVELDTARIEAVEAELAALRDAAPAGGTEDGAAPIDLSSIEATQADLAARLDNLTTRVAALEGSAASGTAAGASTANTNTGGDQLAARVEALASDVAALSQTVEGNGAEIAGLSDLPARLDALEAELAALRSETTSVEDEAQALAREAARNQLVLAIDSGLPFAEPLSVLGDAPDALVAVAESGVATAAALSSDFPALARDALSEARAGETVEGGLGSLAGRFLNSRSLEPREGNDPDAILSRAEAAMRAGDVDTALAELSELPEAARAPFADWIARAEARRDAQAALNEYLQDG